MVQKADNEGLSADILSHRLKAYEIYRQRAVDEYDFISHRLNLLIAAEGMLMALLAAALFANSSANDTGKSVLGSQEIWLVFLATIGIGIFVALATLLSVYAAIMEVEHLKANYSEKYLNGGDPADEEPWLKLTGHSGKLLGIKVDYHVLGHTLAVGLPVIVMILWGVIALLVY